MRRHSRINPRAVVAYILCLLDEHFLNRIHSHASVFPFSSYTPQSAADSYLMQAAESQLLLSPVRHHS